LLTEPGMLQGLDYVRYYSLNAEWMRRNLLEGALPWWNPSLGLGRPFFADIQTGVLYPPHLFHVWLGVPAATVVLVWLHLVMAGHGMLGLTTALGGTRLAAGFAAVALLAGPALAARLLGGQIHYVMALCYLPVIFWLQVLVLQQPAGARSAALAVGAALQMLCGHPQVYWLTAFGLGVFTLGWACGQGWCVVGRTLARLLATLALGLALTGPVLLPFLELISQGNRGEGALSHLGAMRVSDWLGLVRPPGLGYVPDIEGLVLVGLPVVIVAGIMIWTAWPRDPWVRALTALVLASAVLASELPAWLQGGVNLLLPGFAAFRLPARLGILVVLGLLLLTALWLSRPRRSRLPVGLVMGVTGLTLIVAWPALRRWYVMPASYPTEPWVAGLVQELQAGDPAKVPPRLNFSARLVRENSGILTGHSTFNAYGSLYLRRPWAYVHAAAGLPEPDWINSFPDVRIFEKDPFFSPAMNLLAGYDPRDREIKLNPAPDPRAYLVFAAQPVGDWREAVRLMAAGHDFHRIALLEDTAASFGLMPGEGMVLITAFANERVVIRTQASAPAVLVLAETWYPGWEVNIDGEPARAFPVNGWMRGVVVPAGSAEVVWRYRQRWFWPGCALAGVALAGLAGWAWPRPQI
jgi:hypothetical protein